MLEKLHPELRAHLDYGEGLPLIHHPLLVDFCFDQFVPLQNEGFLKKKKLVQEAIQDRDFQLFVFLHARPYRFDALLEVKQLTKRDKTWWDLVGAVWTDSENIWQHKSGWKRILPVWFVWLR